jgi:hypothetical protein
MAEISNILIDDLVTKLKNHTEFLMDGVLDLNDVKSIIALTHEGVKFTSKLTTLSGHEKRAVLISAMQEICTSDVIDTIIPFIIESIVIVNNDANTLQIRSRFC